MSDLNLYLQGRSALERGAFFEALQCFSKLRERKLDLTHTWEPGGSVARIHVEDIDSNLTQDIGALFSSGQFAIYFLSPQPKGPPSLGGIDCRDFCFFMHGNEHAVLLGRGTGATTLSAYRFRKLGTNLILDKIRDLALQGEEVTAVTHRQRGLYVSTAQKNIYRFDDLNFNRTNTCQVSAVVEQLNPGGRGRNLSDWIMRSHLLGVRRGGGLVLLGIEQGHLSEGLAFGQPTQYTDTFVADPDNAGVPAIIACSRDGKLHIYNFGTLEITHQFEYPDEFSALYCHDVDGDGRLEIVVGGRNSLYAFVVDRDRGLQLKWQYKTGAAVTDLWVGNVGGNDKRLVAGLDNGKLQLFTLHPDLEINRISFEAFEGLQKQESSPAGAFDLLAAGGQPEILRFALESTPPPLMKAAEWIAFLGKVEEQADDQTRALLLTRLRKYLERFGYDPILIDYVVGLSHRLFERSRDLPTCERIHGALKDLAVGRLAANSQVADVLAEFSRQLQVLSNPSPQRETEHRGNWERQTFLEKLVLIALVGTQRLDLSGVHRGLAKPITWLVSESDLAEAVKSLLSAARIDQHDTGGTPYYRVLDPDYAAWIRLHSNFWATIREHRETLLQSLRLVDIGRMNAGMAPSEGTNWPFMTLGIDAGKWQTLDLLSQLATPPDGRGARDEPWLKGHVDPLFCKCLGAVFSRSVTVTEASCALAFEMKMPEIKFHGFDRILVVVLHAGQNVDLNSSLEWTRTRGDWRIVIVLAAQSADSLRSTLSHDSARVAVFGNRELIDLFLSESPRESFLDVLVGQVALAALTPYQYAGPVTDMFYGRDVESQLIVNSMIHEESRVTYAVSSARRIGKTSLLLRIKSNLESRKIDLKTIFLDGGSSRSLHALYAQLLGELGIGRTGASRSDFIDEVREYRRRTHLLPVFFLDEADDLLLADKQGEYAFFKTLRGLVNEGVIKLVIAGYRVVYFEMRDLNSPLYNFCQLIELSALDEADARALVEGPLRPLFHIEGQDIYYILERTACYPNFIQFCCSQLVKTVASGGNRGRTITRAHIDRVVGSSDFYDYMIGVYDQNIDDQSRLLLYLLVLSYDPVSGEIIIDRAAHEEASKRGFAQAHLKYELGAEFSADDLVRLFHSYKRSLSRNDVEHVMKKLVLASIFKRSHSGSVYSFRLPGLPAILHERVGGQIVDVAVKLLDRFPEVFGVPP